MSITINPGTGPIEGTTEENARTNMEAFAADLVLVNITTTAITRNPGADADGRYGYQLGFSDGRVLDVQMPGLPLDRVRYVDAPGQDIWDFPRLYVNGNSWIWMFALRQCEIIGEDNAASADEAPEPPLGDQILADTTLTDTEAFAAAGAAYAADAGMVTPTRQYVEEEIAATHDGTAQAVSVEWKPPSAGIGPSPVEATPYERLGDDSARECTDPECACIE